MLYYLFLFNSVNILIYIVLFIKIYFIVLSIFLNLLWLIYTIYIIKNLIIQIYKKGMILEFTLGFIILLLMAYFIYFILVCLYTISADTYSFFYWVFTSF